VVTTAKRQKPVPVLDWTEDDEVPRAGRPDGIRLAKRQRLYRRVVWSTVVLTPLALLALIVVAGSKTPPVVSTHTVVDANTSPGRTAATQELHAWLTENPSPLPNATVVSWDGATPVASVNPPPGSSSTGAAGGAPWQAEIDTFTLEVLQPPPSGQSSTSQPTYTVYKAGVEVALDPAGGAVALGGPSLTIEPPTPSANADPSGPWPGIQSTSTVSGPVSQAINGWLTAYTSGSSSSLGLSVGDPNSAHAYLPLSGVSSATDTVTAAASRPGGAEIVEITINIVWNGQSAAAAAAASQNGVTPPQTTMDLLVERANTAAPVVVAWGAPGSGPTLKPYENAVSASALASAQNG